MRVLYDHQIFQEQNFGGISRYFMELYTRKSGFDAAIAVRRSSNQHLLSQPEVMGRVPTLQRRLLNYLRGIEFRGKDQLYQAVKKISGRTSSASVNRRHSIELIRNSKFDVFHPTYYDPYFLDALGDRPFVLTVFDMIHEFFPEHMPIDDVTSTRKRTLCEKAARIIAISSTTKEDLVELFGIDPGKIDVVFLAGSIQRDKPIARSEAEVSQKYILFTGNRRGYKNFRFFARSVADILRTDESLKLICTGHPFSTEEVSLFQRLGILNSVAHEAASDRDLGALYAGAEMFVFPSLYEGFGMPILEAFACGCPVVLSDTPAMREVAGEAALYFHPDNTDELAGAVSRVLTDKTLKETLISRGHQRAALFSWEKTVLETAEVYRRALA